MEGTPHFLNRDDVLKAELGEDGKPIFPWEVVDVPEWGGSLVIQGLSGKQRDAFERTMTVTRGRKVETNLDNFRAKLLVRAIVDQPGGQGKPLFKESDITALSEKSASALERCYSVAARLSRLSDQDVEELTEALGETPSDDSGSGLHLLSESPTSIDSNDE